MSIFVLSITWYLPPALEHQLCQYVSYLGLASLSHNTIKCYLSAVRHLHIAEGLPDPQISRMARLEQVIRGVKSTQAKRKNKGKERLPISIEILGEMRRTWQREASRDA